MSAPTITPLGSAMAAAGTGLRRIIRDADIRPE